MSSALSYVPNSVHSQQRGRNTAVNRGHQSQRSNSRPRKVNNIVVGKKVVDGIVSWRGADLTTELYVGNVHSNVSTEDARKGITDLGVDVIDLEVVGRHRHFQSFRLRIKKIHLDILKNPEVWPDGIVIRHFFRGKNNNNNNNNNSRSNSGNNNNNNSPTTDGAAILAALS